MSTSASEMPPGGGAWAPVPAWRIGQGCWIALPESFRSSPVRVTGVNSPGNGWRTLGWDRPSRGALTVRSDTPVSAWIPAEGNDMIARIAS